MKLTINLKKRFCKDNNLSISIFEEPYFTDRLELINKLFPDTLEKFELFKSGLDNFKTEQDYNEHYNNVKDNAIQFIKSSSGYEKLLNMDMNEFQIDNLKIPDKHIWKHTSDGKRYVSIDLKKANYQALKLLNPEIVGNTETYEDFISKFTDCKHIINSKYIRQVIFGNCNCKRHFRIEKFIMKKYMDCILEHLELSDIEVFADDEIVFRFPGTEKLLEIIDYISKLPFNVRIEDFTVYNISNTDMYLKLIYGKRTEDITVDFKCVPALYLPFVLRAYLKEDVMETDKYFYNERMLSKLVDYPVIEINLKDIIEKF